jgi:folate-binding protein YgfZ
MDFYAHLPSRALLGIAGQECATFLQGVCTQEIENLPENQLAYGAHLTAQGRFLYDFFILKQDDKILLECAKHELMPLAKSLHKYALNFTLDFEDFTEDYDIFAQWPSGAEGHPDPRHQRLGNRIYLPKGEKPAGTEKTEEDYENYRISLGIPDGSKDGFKERTFTAELGLEYLNGVDFEKGCYVGQELVARLHYRTEAKKRIYQLKTTHVIPPQTSIMAGEQEAGTVFSSNKDNALAIIKTRYLGKELMCGDEKVNPVAPDWWQ